MFGRKKKTSASAADAHEIELIYNAFAAKFLEFPTTFRDGSPLDVDAAKNDWFIVLDWFMSPDQLARIDQAVLKEYTDILFVLINPTTFGELLAEEDGPRYVGRAEAILTSRTHSLLQVMLGSGAGSAERALSRLSAMSIKNIEDSDEMKEIMDHAMGWADEAK